MGHESAAAIKTEYINLAAYYGQTLSDRTIIMYADDLLDLPLGAVLAAMRRLRREPGRRFCPLPSDVRRLVAPDNLSDATIAADIAARIGGAMSRYGYTNPNRAERYIGEVGWRVVQTLGGWRHLCNTITTDEMRTFHAQCRDLARAQLEMDRMRPVAVLPTPALPAPQVVTPPAPAAPPRRLGPCPVQSVGEILQHSAFGPGWGKV